MSVFVFSAFLLLLLNLQRNEQCLKKLCTMLVSRDLVGQGEVTDRKRFLVCVPTASFIFAFVRRIVWAVMFFFSLFVCFYWEAYIVTERCWACRRAA